MTKPETAIVKAILDYLTLKGHFVWRNNSGMVIRKASKPSQKDYAFSYGKVGSSDIIGVTKYGRFIAVEVKHGKNKPTEAQEMFIEDVTRRGGIGFVAWSLDDVRARDAEIDAEIMPVRRVGRLEPVMEPEELGD